jgi:molybdopterin/thiamine biosynthesis adenylyltransferase
MTVLDAISERLETVLGSDRVKQLHRACVAVIGAGLLGGQLLHHLSMLQIKTLLVDPGEIDAANLGNQLLPAAALGESKARVRAEQMKSLNPSAPVRAIEARVEELGLGVFADCNLLLTGLDSNASRLAVNRIAARLGIDWIDAAVDGSGERSYGTVSWLRPDRDDLACFGCRFGPDELSAAAREVRPAPCASWRDPALADAPPTLMASPFGAVVAGLQMTWAIQALLGEGQEHPGRQLQISGGPGVPRVRSIELSRSAACVFPHQRLEPLGRVACGTVGELVAAAEADLGAEPDALVFPERPLAFGLACGACGATSDLVKRCEAVGDAEVRCACRAPGGMGPIEVGNRLEGTRLRALASQPWSALGIPEEDLVTACSGRERAHYLLPRRSRGETGELT